MRPYSEVIIAARALMDDPIIGPILKKRLGTNWKAINKVRSAVFGMLNAIDQIKKPAALRQRAKSQEEHTPDRKERAG